MGAAFAYTAVDRAGKRLRGTEAAPSAGVLAQSLSGRGLLVLEIGPAGAGDTGQARVRGFGARRGGLEVSRALAALLGAGLPLARALDATAGMVHPSLAGPLADVRTRVERGESLASALGANGSLFSPLALGLIRAGERGGDLAGAFRRLAVHLEREHELRSRLLSVSIYPALLATAGGVAVLTLLIVVLPRFAELLQGTGAYLPRSTSLLLGLSASLRTAWPALIGGGVALIVSVAWAQGTPDGRRVWSRLLLQVPGARALRRDVLGARFGRLTAVLLAGGAPLLAALDGAAESLADAMAQEEAARIRSRVREGAAFHHALSESILFPPLLAQLAALGEESGRLTEFLQKAADLLEERTERTVQRLVALAEPAMIIVFGGLVGFVALALLQAVYSINAGSFR